MIRPVPAMHVAPDGAVWILRRCWECGALWCESSQRPPKRDLMRDPEHAGCKHQLEIAS